MNDAMVGSLIIIIIAMLNAMLNDLDFYFNWKFNFGFDWIFSIFVFSLFCEHTKTNSGFKKIRISDETKILRSKFQ